MAAATLFCEHKKLRTSCALCKVGAVPPPGLNLKPFGEEKEVRAPRQPKAPKEPDAPRNFADGEEGPTGRRGPGKPLMPTRQKTKKVGSRQEAEHAEAWWTKK